MKFSILHFSDIHIKTEKDSVFSKIDLIIDSIKNKLFNIETLFIVETGDISNTGNKKEYEAAILKTSKQKHSCKA